MMFRQPKLTDFLGTRTFPHPTALGAGHYVAILKALPGELKALRRLPLVARNRMTALIEVTSQNVDANKKPRSSPISRLPQEFATVFGDRPFFLDVGSLSPRQPAYVRTGGSLSPVPALEHLIVECERRGLNTVPVIRPGLDASVAELLRQLASDGRGTCLRMPMEINSFSSKGLGAELGLLHDLAGTAPEVTDLVIDMRYIDSNPGVESRHILRELENLPMLSRWRSLIFAGTAIPRSLNADHFPEESLRRIRRHEWRWWSELQKLGISRTPTFSDYAVQNPDRLSGGGPQTRANIRYSMYDEIIIVRGRSIREVGYGQYRKLCADIIHSNEFFGESFSWGDSYIESCAMGLAPTGNQSTWRAVGTSHHLQVMIDRLSGAAGQALSRKRA